MFEFKSVWRRPPITMVALALSLGLWTQSNLPAMAAAGFTLTDADVVNALEKAKILAPSIRINARVNPDEVIVATYKNPKADDKDCKIDAVLIAKEVMDMAPNEVPRVTVYFYSSSTLSNYKMVEVTAGDVKAFATGSLSKDELMASIKVTAGAIEDPKARIQEHLQETMARKRQKVTTTIKGEEVLVTTGLDPNLSERSLKFESVKMAEDAFEAAPASVKKVIVTFEDRAAKKENQVLAFGREEVKTLGDAIDGTLKNLKVDLVKYAGRPAFTPGSKVNLDTLELQDGPFKAERQKLVERLKELTKAGVGFGTGLTDQLMEIEDKLTADTEVMLQERIKKLSDVIGKFEENLKGAKERVIVAPASKTSTPAATGGGTAPPAGKTVSLGDGSPDAAKRAVLADPDGFINAMANEYIQFSPVTHQQIGKFKKYKTADEVPNFRRNLQFAIDTLKAANRGAEAEKFQKRLDDIKAKYGE